MAPSLGFDVEGNLVFKKGMHEMYYRFLDMYRDTPHPQESISPSHLGTKEGTYNHTRQ